MQINISVNPTDVADVNSAIQFLNGLVPMQQRDAVRSPSSRPLGVVPISAVDDPSALAMGKPQPEVGENTGSAASGLSVLSTEGSAGMVAGAEGVAAPADAPAARRKPGRPKKEEVAAEAVGKPEPDSSSAPTTASSTTATTSPQPASDYSLADIRAALQRHTQHYGIESGIELLKKFGAQRVSEVHPSNWANFIKECAW